MVTVGEYQPEEIRNLKNEYDWLLTDELPSIFKQLKELIQICLRKFKIKNASAGDGMEHENIVQGNNFLLSLPNSDAVKGLINITGDSVIKAELRFKFPKISNNPIGSFIFEQCPWKLHQLQDVSNHLKMAHEAISEREVCGGVSQGNHIIQLMGKVMASLSNAKNALIVPHKHDLSQLITSNIQVLNPPTPEELVISFHVNCDKVVLCVYVLNSLTQGNTNQRHQQQDNSSIGYTFQHHGRWFEVVNKVEIICAVPWVKDMIVWINSAQQLCQQMKDKIEIFHSILPIEVLQQSS